MLSAAFLAEKTAANDNPGGSPSQTDLFSPDSKLNLGRFGDYELLEEIAHGGMGVVYRARQLGLSRIVAVKMLLLGRFSSPESIQRFQREAKAAASLDHANIVAIHEVGNVEGQHFFSMDYVEGRSLAEVVREKPLGAATAATYCRAIATAIGYAHDHGIIHRDLKPSNILIDMFDQVRITDFGLAKQLDGSSDLTVTGRLLGSPNYLAPEIAAGRQSGATVASDLYSIGAILYECLIGRPPFLAESVQETLLKIRDAEVPAPRLFQPRISRELETICLKCLEKDPANRYASAKELAKDLRRFLNEEPICARPVGVIGKTWRWCRRKPALASFVAATSLLLLAILVGSPISAYRINQARKDEQIQLKRAEAEELAARQNQYASDMNLADQAVQEKDSFRALQLLDRHRPPQKSLIGNRESEIDLRGWEWRYLWLQCQGQQRFILYEHTNALGVGMLADGKTVFSFGEKVVRFWDLESRHPTGALTHPEKICGAAASADGRWLATATFNYSVNAPVTLWDLTTHRVAAVLSTNFRPRYTSITFSADSKWLAFVAYDGGVRLWDVIARTEFTNLPAFFPTLDPLGIAFSPNNRTLAYNENEGGDLALWDMASHSSRGSLRGHQEYVRVIAFSPDGKTLASGCHDGTMKLWNVAGQRERFTLTADSGAVNGLAFSPDGRFLATGGRGRIIRIVDVETGDQTAEFRGHHDAITSLVFTSDGRTLLSASYDGTIRAWDPMPRPAEKVAHEFAKNSISTAWRSYGPALCLSPDGRQLLTVYTNGTFSIWDTLRLTEGAPHPVPFTNTDSAAVASDAKFAAFGSYSGEVMLWDTERQQARFYARPGTNETPRLAFSFDGRYLAAANDAWNIHVWDVPTRKETHVLSTDGQFPMSLTFSADGKVLVAGFSTGQIKLWRLDRPSEVATFLGHDWQVRGLAFLPDRYTLISTITGICFWDIRTGQENAPKLNTKAASVFCVASSPDGRRFATGASDGLIKIWDAASHQELATLRGHEDLIRNLAFTPDGDHLVSVSKSRLRVWRAAAFSQIASQQPNRFSK